MVYVKVSNFDLEEIIMKRENWQSKIPSFLLKSAIIWPLIIALLLLIIVIGISATVSIQMGFVIVGLIVVVIGLLGFALVQMLTALSEYILGLGNQIKSVQSEILLKMPIGIIVFDEDDPTIEWVNPFLQKYFYQKEIIGLDINDLDEEIFELYKEFREDPSLKAKRFQWKNAHFEVTYLRDEHAMYFIDATKYGIIAKNADLGRIVIGHIVIDNYDETVSSMNDRRKSMIDNLVTSDLSKWAKNYDSYIKRLDDDHFLLVSTYGQLSRMEENKFGVVDSLREKTSKANTPLTISMGISYQEKDDVIDVDDISEQGQSNLDLAQSRGGDQVVVRTKNQKARYYGGKTNPMEKRTRVRSRQIANTISTMIQNTSSVFVMGHDYPDMDAVGACLGIRRIAQMNNQICYVIIDESRINDDIERLLVELRKDESIAESIISPEQAEELMAQDSLLFLVDVHRPSITTAPDLITPNRPVIIIDHHRKGEEVPDNVLLEYIEPYASSASELITEFFEYQNQESEPIKRIEATAMLAGMIVDTRNFSLRTGSRTFDAASYLKSVGADSFMIQNLLKEDLTDYIKRNQLIENVELISGNLGIASGEDKDVYDSVTAAQAADTLLSMRNVDASFVVYLREDGRVGISARSLGTINVQRTMEELGGGGHLSNAATQISGVTVSEAVEMLKSVIMDKDEEDE